MPDVPPRVLVTGPASWNLTVRVATLPEPRPHTVTADGWAHGLGGTSAGKAVTLAGLGVDVTLRTVLGEDDAAARIRGALERPGLEVAAVPAAGRASERHVNLVADDGARLSVYLTLPEAVPSGAARPLADLLRGVEAAVVDLAEHSRPVLDAARAAGVPVWCDVHDDDGVGPYARAFTAAADVVLASHVRLADPAAYLRARLAEGARLAVVTQGAAGALALALDDDGAPRWYDVGAAPVHAAVQAEGAGDAFAAGLLWATLTGAPVTEALALAAATGAIAVAGPGLGAPDATPRTVRRLAERVVVTPR